MDKIIMEPLKIRNYEPGGWNSWFQEFRNHAELNSFEKFTDRQKVAALMLNLGNDITPIFETFGVDIDTISYNELVKRLKFYFQPAKARNVLLNMKQKPKESFNQFESRLKVLSGPCVYGPFCDDYVRDIFLNNMDDKYSNVRDKILEDYPDPQLQDVVNIANKLITDKYSSFETNSHSPKDHQKKTDASFRPIRSQDLIKEATRNNEHSDFYSWFSSQTIEIGSEADVVIAGVYDQNYQVILPCPEERSQQLQCALNERLKHNESIMNVEKNKICVVKLDGSWFRVIVLSINDSKKNAKVQSMDFGWKRTVDLSEFRMIPLDLFGKSWKVTTLDPSTSFSVGDRVRLSFTEVKKIWVNNAINEIWTVVKKGEAQNPKIHHQNFRNTEDRKRSTDYETNGKGSGGGYKSDQNRGRNNFRTEGQHSRMSNEENRNGREQPQKFEQNKEFYNKRPERGGSERIGDGINNKRPSGGRGDGGRNFNSSPERGQKERDGFNDKRSGGGLNERGKDFDRGQERGFNSNHPYEGKNERVKDLDKGLERKQERELNGIRPGGWQNEKVKESDRGQERGFNDIRSGIGQNERVKEFDRCQERKQERGKDGYKKRSSGGYNEGGRNFNSTAERGLNEKGRDGFNNKRLSGGHEDGNNYSPSSITLADQEEDRIEKVSVTSETTARFENGRNNDRYGNRRSTTERRPNEKGRDGFNNKRPSGGHEDGNNYSPSSIIPADQEEDRIEKVSVTSETSARFENGRNNDRYGNRRSTTEKGRDGFNNKRHSGGHEEGRKYTSPSVIHTDQEDDRNDNVIVTSGISARFENGRNTDRYGNKRSNKGKGGSSHGHDGGGGNNSYAGSKKGNCDQTQLPDLTQLQLGDNPPIPNHQYTKVVVANPVSDTVAYVYQDSSKAEFAEMFVQLQRVFEDSSNTNNIRCPKKGLICAAPFEGDFYRAEIRDVMQSDAKVFFFDYGNEQVVPLNQLMELPAKLANVRYSFPIKVPDSLNLSSLPDTEVLEVKPKFMEGGGIWVVDVKGCSRVSPSPSCSSAREPGSFKSRSSSKILGVQNDSTSHLENDEVRIFKSPVQLSTVHNGSAADYGDVITQGLKPKSPDLQSRVQSGSAAGGLSVSGSGRPINSSKAQPVSDAPMRAPKPPIPLNEISEVRVVYTGPEGIFVVPHNALDNLRTVVEAVSEAAERRPTCSNPVLMKVYAAPFDNEMYRAKVLSIDRNNSLCQVEFIDFGNHCSVSLLNLIELPKELTENVFIFKIRFDPPSAFPIVDGTDLKISPVTLGSDGSWLVRHEDDS